uniref:RNA polymerase sigma-70 factor n=1 Tax=Roseihalotalea indica TaxID=2867963 RepID=A0AA49GTK6_9BACT|nr:RNA polymerase sigma-70 factor [Tunicatimonas sp. TK19036]
MRTNIPITEPIIVRFVQGQADAFRLIFDAYHGRIFAYSAKIAQSSTEAEEITQQVFIRLWEKRHLVDATQPLEPYLYKITRHCAFNHLKKKAYHAQQQEQVSKAFLRTQRTEENVSYAECERLTKQVINALPEKRQVIFKMHFEEGYSPGEIATLLGISLATVKSQLVKATKTVRNFLLNYRTISWVTLPIFYWFFK